jgi:ectoine hydroxylase-related dioxygenase (phytanoyl-CoA dioxygenase family)
MPPENARLNMTPDQKKAWSQDGLIVVPGALPGPRLELLKARVRQFYGRFVSGEISNYSLDSETASCMPDLWQKLLAYPRDRQTFKRWNIVSDGADFIDLVDHKPVFDLIVEIMGANIQVSRAQMIVIPQGVQEQAFLHTDSGTLGQCFSAPGCVPLMVSVQYFLTDLEGENEGNFAYVPGSQHTPFPEEEGNPGGGQTSGFTQGVNLPGRTQVRIRAGDAVIFPHSLWHGASLNNGEKARLSLIYGYSPLFVRPYDYVSQPDHVLAECRSFRQRRLLGDFGSWAWRPGCLHHPAPDQDQIIRMGAG